MQRYLFVATLAWSLAAGGMASAKERTAGCAGFPRAFLRIESAIRLGAPVWNAGNQLNTYAIYRDTTEQILKELVKDGSCGPLHAVLAAALEQAHKETTPGSAGWDLRHGFDAFIEYAVKGEAPKLLAPRRVPQAEAPFYDVDCPEVFTLVLRAERALVAHRGAEEAKAMAAELGGSGRCPRIGKTLAAAVKKREGEAALDRLAKGDPPPGDSQEPAPILRRCTLAPSLLEEITFAIMRGAPRYDAGHPEACLLIYRKAAEDAISRYGERGQCPQAVSLLKNGLAEASRETEVQKGAWALRHAFDAIGEQLVKAIPP
jgi:hypothetical protein